jgi:hypothetical protein
MKQEIPDTLILIFLVFHMSHISSNELILLYDIILCAELMNYVTVSLLVDELV